MRWRRAVDEWHFVGTQASRSGVDAATRASGRSLRAEANFRFGSTPEEQRRRQEGPLISEKQTKMMRKQTSRFECRLLGVEQTYRRHGRRVRF